MIRRTASEVLRSLETRIARLEGRTAEGKRMYMLEVAGLMAKEWNKVYPDDRLGQSEVERLFARAGVGGAYSAVLFSVTQDIDPLTGEVGIKAVVEMNLYDMVTHPGKSTWLLAADERNQIKVREVRS